ncbi:MAG: hypothetical protein U1E99_05905 [Agitococcus sp.]
MPFGYSNGLASLYTKVSLDTDFALSVDVNLGVSSADVSYPVTANVVYSDTVKAGAYAIVDTSDFNVNNATIKAEFTMGSVEFLLDVLLDPEVKGLYLDTLFTSEGVISDDMLYNPAAYKNKISLLKIAPTTSTDGLLGATVSSDMLPVDITMNQNIPKKIEFFDGVLSLNAAFPGDIEATGSVSSNDRLASVSATGVTDNPLIGGELDILKLLNKTFPATIPPAEYSTGFDLDTNSYVDYDDPRTDDGIKLTLLKAVVGIGEFLREQWTFVPGDVLTTLTNHTTNEVKTGKLGDVFFFATPTTGTGTMDITADYTMTGKLVSSFGLSTNVYFKWDMLGGALKIKGSEYSASLGQVVSDVTGIPQTVTSRPFLPLPLGTPSETSVSNLGGFSQNYTITYDEEYSGPSTLVASFSTTGTEDNDYLFGSSADEVFSGFEGNDRIVAGYGNDTIYAGAGDDKVQAGVGDDVIDAGGGSDSIDGGSGNDIIRGVTGGSVEGGSGNDSISLTGFYAGGAIDGGLGVDSLTVDWLMSIYIAYGVQKSDGDWAYFGYGGNTAVTLDTLLAVSQENSQRYSYLNNGGYYASVTWSSIENITVLGGEYDDVFGYQTGALNSVIAGNGGTDTFFADWSNWSENITWVNDGAERPLFMTGSVSSVA